MFWQKTLRRKKRAQGGLFATEPFGSPGKEENLQLLGLNGACGGLGKKGARKAGVARRWEFANLGGGGGGKKGQKGSQTRASTLGELQRGKRGKSKGAEGHRAPTLGCSDVGGGKEVLKPQ